MKENLKFFREEREKCRRNAAKLRKNSNLGKYCKPKRQKTQRQEKKCYCRGLKPLYGFTTYKRRRGGASEKSDDFGVCQTDLIFIH